MKWSYQQPVTIQFGVGTADEVAGILSDYGLDNGLLVSDRIFVENGTADRLLDASKGRLTGVFSDIVPNPTVENVDACADMIRGKRHRFVLALGGGSAIDCAKAACSVSMAALSAREYLHGRGKLGKERLPLIAMPTTAGTGSEVTPVSVLCDNEAGIKAPLVSDNFYPDLAIVDPALTLSVPPRVTAGTGLDVLSHALEGYWSKNHQPVCDALALHAAGLVFEYLPPAYHDGSNLEYRSKMCEASIIAGLAFGLPKTTGSHACSFPLTSVYGLPHGEACAFTLDSFARINADAEGGRVRTLAGRLGFPGVDAMADRIYWMKKEMGMATTLAEAGIPESELRSLAEKSMHPNMLNNPVDMTADSLLELYRRLK